MERNDRIYDDISKADEVDSIQSKGKGKVASEKGKTLKKTAGKHKIKKRMKTQKSVKESHNNNVFRWAMGALCSAVCEHRWDDAFRLLPCVIIRIVKDVPQDFLWRMTDVITRNATGISLSLRQQLRRDICYLNVKTHDVVLDSLSQDLQTADEYDVDNLIQMMEDFRRKKSSNQFSMKGHQKRVKALLDGYIGQVLYYRWKNCQCQNEEAPLAEVQDNTVSSSQTADIDWPIMHEIFGSHELTAGDKFQVLAKQAHGAMKKALSNLSEPCEWLMERYLDLENELYGTDTAIRTLKIYLEKNPDHLPAHRLSYLFHKHNVPDSNKNQVKALKEIARMCPDDPLVLEYVDALLRDAEHDKLVGAPERRENICMDYDSGLDEWEDDDKVSSPGSQEKQSCLLKSSDHVQALMTCLNLVTALLEYKEFVWKLQPWRRLTCILRKFYLAWINCWSCLLCKQSRKVVDRVAERVTPLWQYYVWTSVPEQISLEKAYVLFHHIFSAYVFSYSMDYISRAKAALYSNGYQTVADELNSYLDYPGPFLKKFIKYSSIKGLRCKRLESETFGSCKHRKEKQIEEYEQNGIQNSNSLECIQNICEENELGKKRNETDPLSLNGGKEECNFESQVGRIFTNRMETQSCHNLLNISTAMCDVSFDEHGILLTSTQVKGENPGNPLSLKTACLAVDPVQNGSFIGCLRTSPVVNVNSADSLCMENAKKLAESPHKQKQRLLGSEIQTEVVWEEISSGNISQNTRLHAVEDKRDETSKETEVAAENTRSSRIVLPQQQESEMHDAPNMVQYYPKVTQRLSFEAENFVSTVNKWNEPELINNSKPQQDRNSGNKIVSINKKTKRHLQRKKRKPRTLISSCPTSPNQEQQNRDLDMNVEEDNYDPQSQYSCSFNNLKSQYNANTFSGIDHDTANQINHDGEVKSSVVSGGTKLLHTHGLDVSNGGNCYGSEDLLQENYMKNLSHQDNDFLEDISGNKTSVPNSGMSREITENSHDLRLNHRRFVLSGSSSKEAESSIPCGQRQCRPSGCLAENSQGQGSSPSPESVEKVGDDSFYFQYTPLPSNLVPSALVPFRHASFIYNNTVVEETLTQLSMKYKDDGIHIIPEAQSQVTKDERNLLHMETVAGGVSEVTISNDQKASEQSKRIVENSEIKCSTSENNIIGTSMKDTVAGTQESVTSLTFSLTPGQRVLQYDKQNAQEFYSSMDHESKIDIDGFCLTEEELCQDDKSLLLKDSQNGTLIFRQPAVSAYASFASEYQSNYLQHHLPVTPPRQVPKMYSDGDTDKVNSSKSTVKRIIHSLGSSTSSANEVLKDEGNDSEYCIGPTQDDFSTTPKRQMIHQSMPCDSLSLGNIVPRSEGESDIEMSSDDLYKSLPALHESFQSTTLHSLKTSVTEGDHVKKENVLELTPLSAMHLTCKEELELLSQPSNENDANCQESLSTSLLGVTSDKIVVKTDEVIPPETKTADQDKVKSRPWMVCIPYRVDENASCTQDTLYKIVDDTATNKPNMDDRCHQDETKEDLDNPLKIRNDQEKVNSTQIEDEILENNAENERISNDSIYVTASDCEDKSNLEYKSFEKEGPIINTIQTEEQCCKLGTVAEARSEKSTRRKKAVRRERKRNLTDEFTNNVNHDNTMMRKHVKCSGNDEDTVDYFPDKDERTCDNTNCKAEGNLEHKSVEEESDTLNKQQKVVSCRKQDAVPVEGEANKNAKKRKFSEKATTTRTVDELANRLNEDCRIKEHQRYSRSKNSVKNNTKKNHKTIDFWLEYIYDLPVPDIKETDDTNILEKSVKEIEKCKEMDKYLNNNTHNVEASAGKYNQRYGKQKKKFELSCVEGLPLPDILIDDVNKAKRNPPDKSEKFSELLENNTLEKFQVQDEQIKVSQCPPSQENKTDIQLVVKCHEKKYHSENSLMPRQRFKEIQKTTIEERAQEKNDGYDFVEDGGKMVDEPVTTSKKRKGKQELNWIASEVGRIKLDNHEVVECGFMSEKKAQEKDGNMKEAHELCQPTKVGNKQKKKEKKLPQTDINNYKVQSYAEVCESYSADTEDDSSFLKKNPKKMKVDHSDENKSKLINIKSFEFDRESLSKAKVSEIELLHSPYKTTFLGPELKNTLEINLMQRKKSKKKQEISVEGQPMETDSHSILTTELCRPVDMQDTKQRLKKGKKRRLIDRENYENRNNAVVDSVFLEGNIKARNDLDIENRKVSGTEAEPTQTNFETDVNYDYLKNIGDVSLHLGKTKKKKEKEHTKKDKKSLRSVDMQDLRNKRKDKKKKQLTNSESCLASPDIKGVDLNEYTNDSVDGRVLSERKIKRGKNYSNEIEKSETSSILSKLTRPDCEELYLSNTSNFIKDGMDTSSFSKKKIKKKNRKGYTKAVDKLCESQDMKKLGSTCEKRKKISRWADIDDSLMQPDIEKVDLTKYRKHCVAGSVVSEKEIMLQENSSEVEKQEISDTIIKQTQPYNEEAINEVYLKNYVNSSLLSNRKLRKALRKSLIDESEIPCGLFAVQGSVNKLNKRRKRKQSSINESYSSQSYSEELDMIECRKNTTDVSVVSEEKTKICRNDVAESDVEEANIVDIYKKNSVHSNLLSDKIVKKKTNKGHKDKSEDYGCQIQDAVRSVSDKQKNLSVAVCKSDQSNCENCFVQMEYCRKNESCDMNNLVKERKNTSHPHQQLVDKLYSDKTIDCSDNSFTDSTEGNTVYSFKKEKWRKPPQKNISVKRGSNSADNVAELSQGKGKYIQSSKVQSPLKNNSKVQQSEPDNDQCYKSGLSHSHSEMVAVSSETFHHCKGSVVGKKVAVLEFLQKQNVVKRLSKKHKRLKEKQSQPSPPWQKYPRHRGKSRKLFNPNNEELL